MQIFNYKNISHFFNWNNVPSSKEMVHFFKQGDWIPKSSKNRTIALLTACSIVGVGVLAYLYFSKKKPTQKNEDPSIKKGKQEEVGPSPDTKTNVSEVKFTQPNTPSLPDPEPVVIKQQNPKTSPKQNSLVFNLGDIQQRKSLSHEALSNLTKKDPLQLLDLRYVEYLSKEFFKDLPNGTNCFRLNHSQVTCEQLQTLMACQTNGLLVLDIGNCTQIKSLNTLLELLANRPITKEGLQLASDAKGLLGLGLRDHNLTIETWKVILSHKNLRELDISEINGIDENELYRITELNQLEKLFIYNVPYSKDFFNQLAGFQNLIALSFGGKKQEHIKVGKFGLPSRLGTLEIKEYTFTNNFCKKFKNCTQLQRLFINNCSIDKDNFKHLPKNRFTFLKLENCSSVNDEFINKMVSAQTELRQLTISNCSMTTQGLQYLKKLPKLETLTIKKQDFSAEDVQAIQAIGTLQTLCLDGITITQELVDVFSNMPNLKQINYSECNGHKLLSKLKVEVQSQLPHEMLIGE
jgi:hypothetical protein